MYLHMEIEWAYANMTESEELKSFLMKVKEESEKVGLKLNTVLATGELSGQWF